MILNRTQMIISHPELCVQSVILETDGHSCSSVLKCSYVIGLFCLCVNRLYINAYWTESQRSRKIPMFSKLKVCVGSLN